MRKLTAILLCVSLVLSMSACGVDRATQKGALKKYWGQISDKGHLRTRGIGSAPVEVTNKTRRRGFSRNAALVSARYEMLSVIKGIRLTGGLSVAQLIEKDSKIAEVAERIISGAEEIQTEWTDDDGCVVVLELRRSMIEDLIDRDRPFEPVSEREKWQTRNSDRSPALRSGRRAAMVDEDAADNAFVAGLTFPGAGHFVAQRPWMGAEERSRVQTRGLCYMAGTLSLYGLGAAALTAKPSPSGQPGSNGHQGTNESSLKGLGYGVLGLGLLVQVLGARDARNSVQSNTLFAVEPERGGARLSFSQRF